MQFLPTLIKRLEFCSRVLNTHTHTQGTFNSQRKTRIEVLIAELHNFLNNLNARNLIKH